MILNNDDYQEDDDNLFEHHSFIAAPSQSPLRVDKFIMNFVENASRNKIQAAAKDGAIFVNNMTVKSNYKVKPGDKVQVMFTHPPYENLLTPEDIPLDIVFEDDYLMVVNKAAGMVVHPGHGNYSGTLINALLHHFNGLPLNSDNRPGLVHRIDKDTSGLLVVAKTEQAMTHLARQFFDKTSERSYAALVWGSVEHDKGTVEGNIGRHPKNRLQNTIFLGDDEYKGKPAITHYEIQERLGYVTLLTCRLETGRTHQIRVHMKHIGHTLFNDARYGGDAVLKGTTFTKYKQFVQNCFSVLPRQGLHAQSLGFEHPMTGKRLSFTTPLPNDMQLCIEKWRNYASHAQM